VPTTLLVFLLQASQTDKGTTADQQTEQSYALTTVEAETQFHDGRTHK